MSKHYQIYYIIEQVGVEHPVRYMKSIGKLPFSGDWTDIEPPKFGGFEEAHKWSSYTSACHKLLHWRMAGTYRVLFVDENEEIHMCQDGPHEATKDCFDERDWREYHSENGRSN